MRILVCLLALAFCAVQPARSEAHGVGVRVGVGFNGHVGHYFNGFRFATPFIPTTTVYTQPIVVAPVVAAPVVAAPVAEAPVPSCGVYPSVGFPAYGSVYGGVGISGCGSGFGLGYGLGYGNGFFRSRFFGAPVTRVRVFRR